MNDYLLHGILFTAIFLNLLTLLLLFFVSIFLVRFRTDLVEYFRNVMDAPLPQAEPTSSTKIGKTWDQKYEDDLDSAARRIEKDRREII